MASLLQPHIKALLKLINPLVAVGKIKNDDPTSLRKIVQHLGRFSKSNELGDAIGSLQEAVEKLQQEHLSTFKKAIAGFINDKRGKGESVKEGSSSWRVGPIELQFKAHEPFLRCLYNKEVVRGWQAITTTEEVDSVYRAALKAIEESKLHNRRDLFKAALDRQLAYRVYRKELSVNRVPILDFYREVRTELLRSKLNTRSAIEKPIESDFPLWAFLYNMDQQLREQGQTFQILVETGSQADTANGMALIFNGLDARYDYKQYCFVKPGVFSYD